MTERKPDTEIACMAVKVSLDSRGYKRLARLVSASDTISCPRCGGEMVLCLKSDLKARGVHFTASFVCIDCDCRGCKLNESQELPLN